MNKATKKKLKMRMIVLLSSLFLVLVSGCKKDEKTTEATTEATTEVTTEVATSEADENTNTDIESGEELQSIYPLEIEDSYGNKVIIENEPQKVISISPATTEIIYQIGASDKLIARSEYCDYPEQVLELPSVGTLFEPDLEKILELSPDLVVCSAIISDDVLEKLDEANIKTMVFYEENNYEKVYDIIEKLGMILNKNQEAFLVFEEMDATLDDVKNKIADKEKPSVYYAISFGEYGDYTATGETYINDMIEIAGGTNIAADLSGWSITNEQIIERDPQIIIVAAGMKESFINDEIYKNLTAVKEDRVYEIDNNLIDRQGKRNAQGIEELSKIFYPELNQ